MANIFTPEEEQIFNDFGLTDADLGVKKFISAQRRVNGGLCLALWATLDALENQVTGKDPSIAGNRSVSQALKHAKDLTLDVANRPPGCEPKNPNS